MFVGRLLAVLLLGAMLTPFAYAVWMSFAPGELLDPPRGEWSLRWYREFFDRPKWSAALGTSLRVAVVSVGMALAGGLGVAVAVTRYHFRGKKVLCAAVLLPLFVPPVVLAMGILPLLMLAELNGTVFALAAAHALVSLPVVFLLLRSALSQVDPDLERAARGLGASAFTAFRRVTLPLVRPAVLTGAVLAFILSANEFTLSVFLGTPQARTLPAALWPEARDKETPLLAAASCLSVLVTLAGMAAMGWLVSRSASRRG